LGREQKNPCVKTTTPAKANRKGPKRIAGSGGGGIGKR